MKMKKLIAGVAVAALPFGIFVGQAAAETATDSVDVYAGLAPVLELTCTDVNFGVWRVPAGERGGANTITLAANGATTVGGTGTATSIALSGTYNSTAPFAGSCTVSGSNATDATEGAASLSVTSGTLAGTTVNSYSSQDVAPAHDANLTYTLEVSDATPAISSGAASFDITGVMTIPEALVVDNYGEYKGLVSHTVSFNDAP